MSIKRIVAVTMTVGVISVIVTAVIWTYLIATYESDLGTSNVIEVSTENSRSDSSDDNQLVSLSFEEGAEDIAWSSLEINLIIDEASYGCSFGSQSNIESSNSKVVPRLSADGYTFTTEVDSTDSESYTYFDLSQQKESNSTEYWMKFSTTDIYLGDGLSWKFIEGASLSEIQEVPDGLWNDTSERLEWYEYDLSVHRVNPNEGVYVVVKDDMAFKINFLTYYNQDDESRYPTMQIAAIGNSSFPALEDPEIVVPSPCKITSDSEDMDNWNSNETINLFENQINLCEGACKLTISVKYETIEVEIVESEIQLG